MVQKKAEGKEEMGKEKQRRKIKLEKNPNIQYSKNIPNIVRVCVQ